ncbi:MAG: histidine kinase [Sporichthyaceae bacterium]
MSSWSSPVVRAIAALSLLVSVAALVVTDVVTGDPLPVQTINLSVIAGGAAVMAVLLHQFTPDNNLWRVLLLIAVAGPVAVVLFAVARGQSGRPEALVGAVWLLDVALAVPWMLFFGLFPDGHRPIQRWPLLVFGSALILTTVSIVAWLTAPDGAPLPVPGHLPGVGAAVGGSGLHAAAARASSVLVGVLPLVAALCLGLRFPRSGPVVRQQIRVGAAGLTAGVLLEVALRTLPGVEAGKVHFGIALVAVAVGAFGVAAALLRWRLWVVDQALPRAVVLGACSAAFTAAIVLVATIATGGLRREQVQGAVLAAVVVTVLAQGYSRRLEPWVRETVYGKRPGGYAVLVGLADGLATESAETATSRIVDAARRGLAVPWAALWAPTARPGVYRLAAKTGDVPAAEVVRLGEKEFFGTRPARLLPPDVERFELPGDSAASAVLSSDARPWAVLVVGQRRGEPLTDGDLELLAVICREAELAHDNRLLLGEVAASLEELRERAQQLRVSRQRLVAAQDEERRRIERDLHDGAQHELIALAGQLRQLARAPAVSAQTFDALADQAEQAVFSLQDLARGIYPSVLTDHGVAAAIRSYVGRMPLDVVLEIAPESSRRRWANELEVALYFVAVEALGNISKHAHATTSTVTLAERDPHIVLEIHDDGVGFELGLAASRNGLQHMSDRMAALGGTLMVESRPGAGTWVTATVPTTVASDPMDATPVSDRTPTLGDTAAPLGLGG